MFQFFRYFSFLSLYYLLSFSRHSFQARTTPYPVNIVPFIDTHNATWHNFSRFLYAGEGAQVNGISELKRYFNRFGYLKKPETNGFSDIFDTQLESAVIVYQKMLGLPVTGKLDHDTLSTIMSPRCGVSDNIARHNVTANGTHTTGRFTYFSGKPRWSRKPPMTLTYAFSKTNKIDYISLNDIKAVFKRAFSRWSDVIPVSFTEAEDYKKADIKIGWYSKDHGDGHPFDGVLGVLAHAFSPENGRVHLDRAETWTVDYRKVKSKVAIDLESVATHEIGHVLGLAHSSVKEAVMYPSLRPRSRKVELRIDDVEGVQALYGSNPNFKFSSFIVSEDPDNNEGSKMRSLSKLTISLVVGGLSFFLIST